MTERQAAIYARVSSERQAETGTIASQVAALRARAAADGLLLPAAREFVDDGYSGTTLVRPALERLRDLAAVGWLARADAYGRARRRYGRRRDDTQPADVPPATCPLPAARSFVLSEARPHWCFPGGACVGRKVHPSTDQPTDQRWTLPDDLVNTPLWGGSGRAAPGTHGSADTDPEYIVSASRIRREYIVSTLRAARRGRGGRGSLRSGIPGMDSHRSVADLS